MAITHTYETPAEGVDAVQVTFTSDSPAIVYQRDVNAVFDENGIYDFDLTAQRVNEVALGVAEKIALGVIVAPAEEE
jgi:lipopolysaccharide export system protein LptC|tara:strand:- start:1119 stop:1349 length:231 start_codon:yes stop_codon:yes gene_type:complete